jgi:hypothetical protein
VELEVGDVFISPGDSASPDGYARKVTAISTDENGNQTIETTEPELEEIYEQMDFATRAVPDVSDVIVYDGVTVSSVENSSDVVYASAQMNSRDGSYSSGSNIATSKGANFEFKFNFQTGIPSIKAGWTSEYETLKADLTRWKSKDEEKIGQLFELSSMDYNNEGEKPKFLVDSTKFEGGYEITGTVKIENLYVDVVSETTKTFGIPTGIKNFELKTNYDVVLGLDFKGKLEGEIKFAKFYVPTEVPGLTVEMQASLYCNANGQLSLKLTVTNTTTLGYSDGKLKKVSQSDSVSDKLTFAVEVEPGASITAIPEMLGIKIIDLKIKAGVKFKFETSVEAKAAVDDDSAAVEYIFKLTGNFIYPIVTLEAGSDKSRSLIKLNFSYPVVGEKNAPITAQTVEFFDKEYSLGYVIGDEVETETETEDTEQVESAEFKTAEFGERLDIDTYTIGVSAGDVSSIQVTMIPEGYSESDITWESEDPSVATVSGGIVTGVGEGSTQIKVKTSDGKYEAYCAVIVTEQSDFEFHEL